VGILAALDLFSYLPCGIDHRISDCFCRSMKAKNLYKRVAKPLSGVEEASRPRSHAEEPAGDATRKQNPQRLDIIRRHMLSGRKSDDI
jgi:hypothetical protein